MAPVLLAVAEVAPVLVAPVLVAEEAEVAISPAEQAVVLLAVAETALVLLAVAKVAISTAAQAVYEALLEKHALKHRQHEFQGLSTLVDVQSEVVAVDAEVVAVASAGQSQASEFSLSTLVEKHALKHRQHEFPLPSLVDVQSEVAAVDSEVAAVA